MQSGQVRYSLVCNESGGILDDVLVYCLSSPSESNYFLLVVNASNRVKIVDWFQKHLGDFPDVTMRDTTEATGMIAIQGPKAMEICQGLLPAKCMTLGYYRGCVTHQMSKPVIVSRTGYTGEDGLELIVKADDAARVWENLMLAGRSHQIVPAGLGARDTLRLEAGMPLYGHELDENIDPIQAGLEFAVTTKERTFIGRDAILRAKSDSSHAIRVGLALEGRRAARQGSEVLDGDSRVVGVVTSGSFSPTLDRPIAMAYVAPSMGNPGLQLDVDIRGSRTAAHVVALPFYKRSSN
jgi:aminomethyltransferase